MPAPNLSPAEIARRFTCNRCGNCCRGDGFVSLTERDIHRISEFLGLEPHDFLDQFAFFDKPAHEWRLRDQGDERQSCIFLQPDNSCRVHEVKPRQCTGFPTAWRADNIEDFCEGWRRAAGIEPFHVVAQDTMTPRDEKPGS